MPYNYAIAGEKLEPSKHHIRRPLNYFDAVQNISKGLLEYNINTYLGWASGEGTRS
jgi:hypothetical protein